MVSQMVLVVLGYQHVYFHKLSLVPIRRLLTYHARREQKEEGGG
jgi:hypothetical protein